MSQTEKIQVNESCNTFRDDVDDDLNDLYALARAIDTTDNNSIGPAVTYAASRIEKKIVELTHRIKSILGELQ